MDGFAQGLECIRTGTANLVLPKSFLQLRLTAHYITITTVMTQLLNLPFFSPPPSILVSYLPPCKEEEDIGPFLCTGPFKPVSSLLESMRCWRCLSYHEDIFLSVPNRCCHLCACSVEIQTSSLTFRNIFTQPKTGIVSCFTFTGSDQWKWPAHDSLQRTEVRVGNSISLGTTAGSDLGAC